MEEKIKELYNCDKLKGDDSLVIWYNQVIEKTADELTVSDVARCIRQNLFLETAYEMLMVYLLQNPYEGDVYEGELIDKACEIDLKYLLGHRDTISEIISRARQFIKTNEWDCEEDKIEFEESINTLEGLINKDYKG